jgi:S1-C subfamily serine protease
MSNMVSTDILQTLSSAIEGIAETVGQSVVGVGSGGRTGSGIVWDGEGHVVTAYHVVRGLREVEVGSGDRRYTAEVLGHDARSDIALLKIDAALPAVEKSESSGLKVGQFVLALANPFASRASITSGIVTGVGRTIGGWWGVAVEDAIVSDARVNPGYSGGPLVDARGRLVGINIAWVSSRAITVPLRRVSKVLEKLLLGKVVPRAFLGIITSPVPLPRNLGAETSQRFGLMVLSVEDSSPAQKAGVAFGDVLLSLDGRELAGLQELGSMLTEEAIGREAKLQILRGGRREDVRITPGEAPEE